MKAHELITEIQDSYDGNPSQDAQVFILFSFLLLVFKFIKPTNQWNLDEMKKIASAKAIFFGICK